MIDIDKLISEARKNDKRLECEVYKLLKAKILEFKTSKNAPEYTEAEQIKIIQKMIQERCDSACVYLENHRQDLADDEYAEIKILDELLPELPTEKDIDIYLSEHYPNGIEKKQMSFVIKEIKEALIGVEGKLVANCVKKILV